VAAGGGACTESAGTVFHALADGEKAACGAAGMDWRRLKTAERWSGGLKKARGWGSSPMAMH
jgi:hypothetical protein